MIKKLRLSLFYREIFFSFFFNFLRLVLLTEKKPASLGVIYLTKKFSTSKTARIREFWSKVVKILPSRTYGNFISFFARQNFNPGLEKIIGFF